MGFDTGIRFGAATVASGWSGYFISLMDDWGIRINPKWIATSGTKMVFYKGHWMELGNVSQLLTPPGLIRQHCDTRPEYSTWLLSRDCRGYDYFGGRHQGIGQSHSAIVIGQSCDRTGLHRHCRRIRAPPPSAGIGELASFHSAQYGKFGEFGWSGVARGAAVISLPTSDLMPYRRRHRRLRILRRTCRLESSARSSSARFSTSWSRAC